MYNYREEQNHRWAHNLKAAKSYFLEKNYQVFYNGMIENAFPYPGMKIMGAFWVAEDREMKERYAIHEMVLDVDEEAFIKRLNEFYQLFLDDFLVLSQKFGLFSSISIDELFEHANSSSLVPDDWQNQIQELQAKTEICLKTNQTDEVLLDEWFFFCGRFILSYARNLIAQGVRSALYVLSNGKDTLEAKMSEKVETFSWKINRIFFNEAMPQTGFEDLGDIISLGAYGMLSDQAVDPSYEEKEGIVTKKRSILKTCQLFGFIDSVATFMGLEKGATTASYCPFCVGHGRTTMHFVIPPDRTVNYSLETGLGYGNDKCTFLLETIPGDDDERIYNAESKIFGDEPLEY